MDARPRSVPATLGGLLLIAPLLAGCATFFPPTAPEPYSDVDLPPVPDRTLASVDTRTVALGRARTVAVDLPTVLSLAAQRSPEIALASLRVEQEQSVERADELTFLPGINPIFRAYSHQGRAQPQTGIIVDVTRTNFEAQLFLVALVQPGSAIFSALASRRRQDAARAGEETARLENAHEAAIGYFELVRSAALVEVARDALEAARELERTESSREKLGAALREDVLRARAEVADREQDVSLAVGSAALASARLARTLQLGPDLELVATERTPVALELFPADASVTSLVALAMEERPELREARGELGARERLEDSATVGRLIPFVGGFLQTGDFGPTLGKMRFSQDAFAIVGWQIGPGGLLDIPEMRERRLEVREQRLAIEKLVARIEGDVAYAHARVRTASEELPATREAVEAASESLRIARDRLAKGAGTELEVLVAERLFFRARARAIEAVIAYDEAQYELLRACGKTGRS